MRPFLLAGALAATSLAVAIADQPAKALCLTAQAGNNCTTFAPDTISSVLQEFTSTNLPNNTNFQIGFRSSNGTAYAISNVRYSVDNITFSPYGAGSFNTGASYVYGSVDSGSLTNPFYIAYDLPSGIPNGVIIDSSFSSNNNGLTDSNGVLISGSGNNFVNIERSSASTSTPVPAPLPILGAAAAFSQVRRLRSMSKVLR